MGAYTTPLHKPQYSNSTFDITSHEEKGESRSSLWSLFLFLPVWNSLSILQTISYDAVGKPIPSLGYGVQNRRTNMIPKVQDEQERTVSGVSAASTCRGPHGIVNTDLVSKLPNVQPPPHPLPIIPGEKVYTDSEIPTKASQVMTNSIQVYTIASLQQYTNSFSQENYLGEGTLGPVYRAELPDGMVNFFHLFFLIWYI